MPGNPVRLWDNRTMAGEKKKHPRARGLLACLMLLLAREPLGGDGSALSQDQGGHGLGLALRRLGVVGSVLYVTAHPDDEDNGVLVMLRRGLGLETALLTLTRGEGGQNELGPELFEALGVLRSEELAAVHRYDDAEQYFTHAYDFGNSFSVEESLEKWGHEETLADIVRVVRAVRPDVILTLPLRRPGDGQHHQAAALLAREAFRAAADAWRFPEQLQEGLLPWQARKIYQGGVGGAKEELGRGLVRLATSSYDPLLGMSWAEFGSLARAMHRSQGHPQIKSPPGEGEAVYALVDSEPVALPEKDLLDGVDTSIRGLLRFVRPGESPASVLASSLDALERDVKAAQSVYDPRAPEKTLPPLRSGLQSLRALREHLHGAGWTAPTRHELLHRLSQEEKDFEDCLALAHGLVLDPASDDDEVVPGETFTVTTRVWNAGTEPMEIDAMTLRVPEGWSVSRSAGVAEGRLGPGQVRVLRDLVTVSQNAPPAQPLIPSPPPEVVAHLRYLSGDVASTMERSVISRQAARSGGERRRLVSVVPALSVSLTPQASFFPGGSGHRVFRVTVGNHRRGPARAVVRLEAPRGFGVEPTETQVAFRREGEEATLSFRVAYPGRPALAELRAVARESGSDFREGLQVVAYDHVQERHLLKPAVARVFPGSVRVFPTARVGYVASGMDTVDEAMRQLGVPVTLLAPEDLSHGDLSAYSSIVTGIRAYEFRRDLRAHHARVLNYVEEGGHLVVQYNKLGFNAVAGEASSGEPTGRSTGSASPFAPYPALIGRNRVTAEEAPVRFLVPGHPLLTIPNRITSADFEGWVQERGLYFLEAKDPRYTELLSASDPWPNNPGEKTGMLVEAKVGKGTWTYVGLGLFRQVAAGTPGACRILANLVSRSPGR